MDNPYRGCDPALRRVLLGALFAVIAVGLFLLALSAGCKRRIRTDSPTKMVVAVPSEDRTGRTAEKARNYIYSLVPAEFQPQTAKIRIREIGSRELSLLRMRDKLAPLDSPAIGIPAYTQFPANNPDEVTEYTTIYIVPNQGGEDRIAYLACHEYAHAIYWLQATEAERYQWGLLWQAARESNALPTEYAATSQFEGFADAFAYWCVGKLTSGKLRDFFDDMKAARKGN